MTRKDQTDRLIQNWCTSDCSCQTGVVLDRSALLFPCRDMPQLPPTGKVLIAQSCPTLCDPKDCSPPGSPVPGILQARILERVAMPSSWGPWQSRDRTHISYASCTGRRVFSTTATWEAIPSPGDLHPRIKPGSPALQADSLPFESLGKLL